MHTLLENNIFKQNKTVLLGDVIINLLEHETHSLTSKFLVNLQTFSFYPHISRPTRFPDNSGLGTLSLLELKYTNFNNEVMSGILHFPISDHLPVFLNVSIPHNTNELHNLEL